MNMTVVTQNFWGQMDHLDIFKIRLAHMPNDEWRHGLGFMVFNACFIIYWGKL